MITPNLADNGLEPVRGNNHGIATECARLKKLADQLDWTGRTIMSMRVDDSWDGRARDHFDDARSAIAKNWLHAADSHYKAAAVLGDYQVTLENVQLLAHSAIADAHKSGFDPAVVENTKLLLARWRQQLDEVGQRTAAAIRSAHEDLTSLRRVLHQPNPAISRLSPTPTGVAPQPPTRPQHISGPSLPSPYEAHENPYAYQRRLRALNAAVLDSWLP